MKSMAVAKGGTAIEVVSSNARRQNEEEERSEAEDSCQEWCQCGLFGAVGFFLLSSVILMILLWNHCPSEIYLTRTTFGKEMTSPMPIP